MTKLVKFALGLVALFAVAIAAAFLLTADMKKQADAFFAAVKAKDHAAAYQLLSEDFRAATTQPEFTQFLEKTALARFERASWSNRQISGGRGELDGAVTTEGGGVIPIKLGFVKENGKWLIYSLHKPRAGLTQDDAGKVPSDAEQVRMVVDALQVFARSINADDFSEFHRYVSILWQRQITVQQLNGAFKPFMDADIDLTKLDSYTPTFDEPTAIGSDGILVITGHYPTRPSSVIFRLKWVYEGVGWKLMGTNVELKSAN
jgi:hypothetical protein